MFIYQNQIFISLTILVFKSMNVESNKYSECENLPFNSIKILDHKNEMKVWFGSEVSLTCCMKENLKFNDNNDFYEDDFELANSKNSPPLIWYDPNNEPVVNYFTDPQKAQNDKIFMIPDMLHKPKGVQVAHLIIKDFKPANNGIYRCDTAQSSSKTPSKINIVGNPKVIIDSPRYQFIEEGKTGYINCTARGHPRIDVVWFFEGEHLSPDNHKFSFIKNQGLRISEVTEWFRGKYLCKAEVSFDFQEDMPPRGSFIEVLPIDVIVYKNPEISPDSPSVTTQKSETGIQGTIFEDGNLEIECDSRGLPPPKITWFKDNKMINNTVDPRVQISESYYSRNVYSVLKIFPVQAQDIGVYTCNSSYSYHGFSRSVARNITPEFIFQPRFLKIGTNLNATSLADKNVNLSCSVFGAFSNRLTVSFIHEDFNNSIFEYTNTSMGKYAVKMIQYKSNPYISHYTLTISDIKPQDAGTYYCKASVRSGKYFSLSHNGIVSVLYAPEILPTKSTLYGLWYKKNVLKCKAKGYPNPTWEWTFQDYPLPNHYNQYLMKTINNNDTSTSELIILPNVQNDAIFGIYECTARNPLGNISMSMSFSQAWQPGAPNVNVCKVTSSTIQLCVTPNSDSGGLPLTHYEMRFKDFEVNRVFGPYYYPVNPSTITLSHLKPNTRYKLALSAASEAGRGANTDIEVTTKHLGRPVIELVNTSTADSKSFNLQWVVDTDGGAPILRYDVEVQQVDVDPLDNSKIINRIGNIKYYIVDDLGQFKQMFHVNSLKSNTWYELKFTALNSFGRSPMQEVIFRTLDEHALSRAERLRQNYSQAIILMQSRLSLMMAVILLLIRF